MLIRPSRPEDAALLAPRLREADRLELEAANGADPLGALERAYSGSKVCLSVERDGAVVAMSGVGPPCAGGVGVVWLMGAPDIVSDRRWFWHQSKRQLLHLVVGYRVVYNTVDDRYGAALRWLTRLGFRRVAGGLSEHSGLPLSVMALEVANDGLGAGSDRGDCRCWNCRLLSDAQGSVEQGEEGA